MELKFTEKETLAIVNSIVEIVRLNFLEQHGEKHLSALAKVLIDHSEEDQDGEDETEERSEEHDNQPEQDAPAGNINEAEQQWLDICLKNAGKIVYVHHMLPSVDEVAEALGYTVDNMPDVIAQMADGSYGEVKIEDLLRIAQKAGCAFVFRQCGNDDVNVADLDPSNYPLTEDKEDEIDDKDENDPVRKPTNGELYENLKWSSPAVVLFNDLDVTKDDLVDHLCLNGADELPSDLVFGAGDIISFSSFKYLAKKLEDATTILVRLPKGIFEVKNLNL